MRTNGGCRCFEHPIIRSKMALIINSFADGELINIKTATIEDLKQNPHVQGLLEIIDIYGNELDWDGVNNPAYIQDKGKRARAKLKEWE